MHKAILCIIALTLVMGAINIPSARLGDGDVRTYNLANGQYSAPETVALTATYMVIWGIADDSGAYIDFNVNESGAILIQDQRSNQPLWALLKSTLPKVTAQVGNPSSGVPGTYTYRLGLNAIQAVQNDVLEADPTFSLDSPVWAVYVHMIPQDTLHIELQSYSGDSVEVAIYDMSGDFCQWHDYNETATLSAGGSKTIGSSKDTIYVVVLWTHSVFSHSTNGHVKIWVQHYIPPSEEGESPGILDWMTSHPLMTLGAIVLLVALCCVVIVVVRKRK